MAINVVCFRLYVGGVTGLWEGSLWPPVLCQDQSESRRMPYNYIKSCIWDLFMHLISSYNSTFRLDCAHKNNSISRREIQQMGSSCKGKKRAKEKLLPTCSQPYKKTPSASQVEKKKANMKQQPECRRPPSSQASPNPERRISRCRA